MMTDEEYLEISRKASVEFFKIPGVHSVGIGGRRKNGKPTGEIVIKVYVTHKKKETEIPPGEMIPKEFLGVPTDIVQCKTFEKDVDPPGGVANMTREQQRRSLDNQRYRPLRGGCRIQARRENVGVGTLGCLLDRSDDNTKVYALTNHHVLFGSGNPGVANTKAGQPSKYHSLSGCCSDLFGVYKVGEDGANVDAAIIQLDSGTRWLAEVLEIGVIKGKHAVTVAEAATGTYQVRKRGITSRLTGGVVESIGSVSNSGSTIANGVIIRANPIPGNSTGTPFFCQKGDSGSVVVNKDNKIISLHFATSDTASDADYGFGYGVAIDQVLNWMQSQGYPTLKVATATSTNDVRVVPSSATSSTESASQRMIVPWGMADSTNEPAEIIAAREKLENGLKESEKGQLIMMLWMRHQQELFKLINTNRRVATVWHRSGAADLLHCLIAVLYNSRMVVPNRINGRTVTDCIQKLYRILWLYGSQALKADMQEFQLLLPDFAGKGYDEILKDLKEK